MAVVRRLCIRQFSRVGGNRNPSLPLDRQLRYGTGIQYEINDEFTVGIANEVLNGGSAPYDVKRGPLAGRLQGDFSSNIIDFLGINLVWKLGSSSQ